jgi:hypothetical protein
VSGAVETWPAARFSPELPVFGAPATNQDGTSTKRKMGLLRTHQGSFWHRKSNKGGARPFLAGGSRAQRWRLACGGENSTRGRIAACGGVGKSGAVGRYLWGARRAAEEKGEGRGGTGLHVRVRLEHVARKEKPLTRGPGVSARNGGEARRAGAAAGWAGPRRGCGGETTAGPRVRRPNGPRRREGRLGLRAEIREK